MKKIAIILHNGVEETEALTPVDLIRRANLKIDLISTTKNLEIVSSHQVRFFAEKTLSQLKVEAYDGIIFPGGPAVEELLKMDPIIDLAKTFAKQNKLVAAICAGPQILGKAGILKGKKVTHFPASNQFMTGADEQLTAEVLVQGNVITSRGAGTAVKFGLSIVEYLAGATVREQVEKQIACKI